MARSKLRIPAARPQQRTLQRGQQQDRELRLESIADSRMQGAHALAAQPAACALVGLAGVGITIAQHYGTGSQGGAHHLCERLRPVGEHQGHLGFRGDAAQRGFTAGVEQHAADAVAQGGPARLPQCHHLTSFIGQGVGEPPKRRWP